MQIIQATFGTFHHFDLARELNSRGHLKHIYSTYPWSRLQREGLPHALVSTFPWIHTSQLGLARYVKLPQKVFHSMSVANAETFDSWVSRKLTPCDVFIAISGAGAKSGKRAQHLGAKYICDRGSTHIRFQHEILLEEYRKWNIERIPVPARILEREETEYANADAITIPSEFCRKTFIRMGVPATKVHKVPYGVRLELFHPVGAPSRDMFQVLFVGQVSFRKGIPYLLEAFRKLRHPKKALKIVGSVTAEIKPFLSSQNLENVEILGIMPQARLKEVMSTSHVLVMPSIEEGLALVQGQAMACGCPLISTENSGAEDLITHEKEGFIVTARDPQAITERLQQFADDPELRQRMGQAAMERTKAMGGWHQYGENYTNLLKGLCRQSDFHEVRT
jgi:starch synthase